MDFRLVEEITEKLRGQVCDANESKSFDHDQVAQEFMKTILVKGLNEITPQEELHAMYNAIIRNLIYFKTPFQYSDIPGLDMSLLLYQVENDYLNALEDKLLLREGVGNIDELKKAHLAAIVSNVQKQIHDVDHIGQDKWEDLYRILNNWLYGDDILTPLLTDPQISQIHVNGPNKIWAEINNELTLTGLYFKDSERLVRTIQKMPSTLIEFNEENSNVSTLNRANFRMNATYAEGTGQHKLTINKDPNPPDCNAKVYS